MKKREQLDDLRWRVERLEALGEQRKESRDAEIATMKTVHEVSAFWRMRAEGLQKKLADPTPTTELISELQQERDGFAQQAKELREQLNRVAAVRDGGDARQADYWKKKCLEIAAERDGLKARVIEPFVDPAEALNEQLKKKGGGDGDLIRRGVEAAKKPAKKKARKRR